jgi:hypothetical protein
MEGSIHEREYMNAPGCAASKRVRTVDLPALEGPETTIGYDGTMARRGAWRGAGRGRVRGIGLALGARKELEKRGVERRRKGGFMGILQIWLWSSGTRVVWLRVFE